jgi:hypothetical protein
MIHINKSTIVESQLQQIAEMLILNGTLVECPGLVNGKMGISIFFFHYAQYTSNELFENYALDLIREIQAQIHNNSPADYENGLAGIGVGMDYLINHQFLCADEDIFEDFDKRMYRAVMYDTWHDFSLYDGLSGYGQYWITRLRYPMSFSQAQECLKHIVKCLEEEIMNIAENEHTDVHCFLLNIQKIAGFNIYSGLINSLSELSPTFSRFDNSLVGNVAELFQLSHYFEHVSQVDINAALKQMPDIDMDKPPVSMGLLTGYAGEGLIRLTELNQTNKTWMLLL